MSRDALVRVGQRAQDLVHGGGKSEVGDDPQRRVANAGIIGVCVGDCQPLRFTATPAIGSRPWRHKGRARLDQPAAKRERRRHLSNRCARQRFTRQSADLGVCISSGNRPPRAAAPRAGNQRQQRRVAAPSLAVEVPRRSDPRLAGQDASTRWRPRARPLRSPSSIQVNTVAADGSPAAPSRKHMAARSEGSPSPSARVS